MNVVRGFYLILIGLVVIAFGYLLVRGSIYFEGGVSRWTGIALAVIVLVGVVFVVGGVKQGRR